MKIMIVGGGKTLYFLCRRLIAKGYEVVLINREEEECVKMAHQLPVLVICGDGSDPQILKESGAMGTDVVLALTPNDQDNLIICQLSSLQFGVPRVLALANDPDNMDVFGKLGIPAFSTADVVGSLVEQRASVEQILNLLPIAEGRVNVTELLLDENSPVVGKLLRDISLPENALVAVLIRKDQAIVPRGGCELLNGDRLLLITLPENHAAVLRFFTGEKK